MKHTPSFAILLLALLLAVIPNIAKAQDETVDIGDLPVQLADRLNIPLAAAELLCVSLFLGWFMFPGLLLAKDHVSQSFIVVLFGFPIFGFAILMEWLDYWFLILAAMIVGIMYAGKIRETLSGG